jgi:hypothetical protein
MATFPFLWSGDGRYRVISAAARRGAATVRGV